jgi:hypothetical protein
LIFATAWAGAGSRVDVSAHAVAHSQPQHSRSWAITVRFGDGTIARGYVDPDPPGVGQSVTIRVDLSCGHTHTLHGIQDAEGHMHGEGYDSVTPGHTSSASVKASKNSGPDPVPSWDGGPSS